MLSSSLSPIPPPRHTVTSDPSAYLRGMTQESGARAGWLSDLDERAGEAGKHERITYDTCRVLVPPSITRITKPYKGVSV